MPYELSFTKHVDISDREQYINECCVGGDIVMRQMLHVLRQEFGDIEAVQEDWGWFAWFSAEGLKLAVDVFCDDPNTGEFTVHLTSSISRIFVRDKIVDSVQLEHLRKIAVDALSQWIGAAPRQVRLNDQYMPIGETG